MSSSQSELRFCASSAAMAQLISKVTTARGETEGLIFGTILNRQYRHPTDTDYNAVKHDCLVTVKQVVMTERNAFSNKDNLVDALKLEKVIKDAKADYSPLGWFSCRRDKGAQLTFREKAVIRSFCAGKALMSDFGTLFIRLSLEVTQQSSRHTSQYQAYYGQPNSRKFVSVPFDVVNLGDTSHSDYKSGSSLGLEHIPSAHLNVLNPKQTVQQAVEFREKIESLLDETCAKLKKANRKLDDSLISESSHENWITRILANLPSMEDYNQVVEEEDWYRQQRLDASLVPEGAICQGLDLDLEQSAQSQLSVIPTPNASFQGFDNEETKSDPTDQLFSALEKEKREEITGDSRNCDESFSQKSGKSQECEEEHSATKTTTATRAGGALKKKRSDAEEKGNAESNGKICIVTRSTKSTKSVKVESNGGSNSKSNPAGSDA